VNNIREGVAFDGLRYEVEIDVAFDFLGSLYD
jgi:hypothetical protein